MEELCEKTKEAKARKVLENSCDAGHFHEPFVFEPQSRISCMHMK